MAPAEKYKGPEEEKEEAAAAPVFKSFMESARTVKFINKWNQEGYTKAGISELLFELHSRYAAMDIDMVYDRGDEILSVLKRVDLGKFKLKPEGPPEGPPEGEEPPEGGGR